MCWQQALCIRRVLCHRCFVEVMVYLLGKGKLKQNLIFKKIPVLKNYFFKVPSFNIFVSMSIKEQDNI